MSAHGKACEEAPCLNYRHFIKQAPVESVCVRVRVCMCVYIFNALSTFSLMTPLKPPGAFH